MAMPPNSPETGGGKTNGFAITALVTAILGCTAFLGLIFGFIALSQIKRTGGRGRGMAIAGIVVACAWFAGSIATFVLLPSAPNTIPTGALPSATPTHTKPHALEVGDIKPGQCFNDTTNGNNGKATVEELTIVGCATPHDAQALATFTFQRGPWPGDRTLTRSAGAQCRKRTARRIAHDPARRILNLSWYLPTQQGWGLTGGGDRGVLCVVTHAKQGRKLTRRIR
ncbi:MAG TPA: DUF4190 domain-containing protein [Streptosporangiaceae bacterium]|jgi:hypothetical protein